MSGGDTEESGGFAELLIAPQDGRATGSERREKALLEIVLPCGIVVRAFSSADEALLRAAVLAVRSC